MVIKGRSRTNGAQLADYLLHNKENDRAHVLDIRGTANDNNLKKSLIEMSLSSELTKRGKLGLYHAQVNPAIGEDRPMTPEDWLKAADILEESLGLLGQKRAIVLHEKNGRVHGHVVWERYDHDTGKLRADGKNYDKHDKARAEIERELGHELTPQKSEREPTDKERLTQLWRDHSDGRDFVEAAEREGFQIANGNDRRPFRVVTPNGQSLDLVRQLEGIKTREVRGRLHPIRDELQTEAEALQAHKKQQEIAPEREQPEATQSDNSRDLSDSQNLAEAMRQHVKQAIINDEAPSLPHPPDEKNHSDKKPELSDNQNLAATMLEQYRQRQREREAQQRKAREMQQQADEKTRQAANDNELTDQAAQMLEAYRKRQQDRGRGRDGPEY